MVNRVVELQEGDDFEDSLLILPRLPNRSETLNSDFSADVEYVPAANPSSQLGEWSLGDDSRLEGSGEVVSTIHCEWDGPRGADHAEQCWNSSSTPGAVRGNTRAMVDAAMRQAAEALPDEESIRFFMDLAVRHGEGEVIAYVDVPDGEGGPAGRVELKKSNKGGPERYTWHLGTGQRKMKPLMKAQKILGALLNTPEKARRAADITAQKGSEAA